eukprot:m.130206 g.130206  ORF g.130206 m.130206 type:complete len:741 (+) comp19971_c0_seq5:63-2285(+)
MSRHRQIRNANYDDYDYDDYEEEEEEDSLDTIVSPSVAQFMYNRSEAAQPGLHAFFPPSPPKQEQLPQPSAPSSGKALPPGLGGGTGASRGPPPGLSNPPKEPAAAAPERTLTASEHVKLDSGLDYMQSVLGSAYDMATLRAALLQCDCDGERALDFVLSGGQAAAPKAKPKAAVLDLSSGAGKTTPFSADDIVLSAQRKRDSETQGEAKSGRSTARPSANTTPSITPRASGPNSPRAPRAKGSKAKLKVPATANTAASLVDDDVSALGLTSSSSSSRPTSKQTSPTASPMPDSGKARRRTLVDAQGEHAIHSATAKPVISLVIIGHVDAGKSTMMGHLLCLKGDVSRRDMHKNETESRKIGKASFLYSWVLDETEEERSRGVTIDVAQRVFETEHRRVQLLDAPGHKDFIPNMISGAAVADAAVLVIGASRGEFEAGFDLGGQTREHAVLARSLGISQLAVAVNKMDTCGWSEVRYTEIKEQLGAFLKQIGFKEKSITFLPCSGFEGDNLAEPLSAEKAPWFQGPSLLQVIDNFNPAQRDVNAPLRFSVSDVYKGTGASSVVSGKLLSGFLRVGESVSVYPAAESCVVKAIETSDGRQWIGAGESSTVTVSNVDGNHISVGSVLCDTIHPVQAALKIRAQIIVFDVDIPIPKGCHALCHVGSRTDPCVVAKLVSLVDKSTGEIIKTKPRCLDKGCSAIVEVHFERPFCLELYRDNKDLGRFMLRRGTSTIAAGVVTAIL